MLTYVVMILNHHRLCHVQNHPHLPLNLIDLCEATQQIGAFQVRVRLTLTQVLFSELQRSSFWNHWADWSLQILEAWTERPPAICQTLGLLPLQGAEEAWAWRERVVIQAMALEAAHQLVESLPTEALAIGALEQLLGLRDALVEDSSTIDPRGFEPVTLGLPLLAAAAGRVTTRMMAVDPTLGRLPQLSIQVSPQSSRGVSVAQVLGRWVWEISRQLGLEVGYVGVGLIGEMAAAQAAGQDEIWVRGTEMLATLGKRGSGEALKALVRRVELLCQSTVRWEEQRLERQTVHSWQGKLWDLEAVESTQGLGVTTVESELRYLRGEWVEVELRIKPGRWCDRLVGLYGAEASRAIQAMGLRAQQLLRIDPKSQEMAARAALFLGVQVWTEQSQGLTVGDLLEAVATEEKVRAIAHPSIRREAFLQDWARMWACLHEMGWVEAQDPLQGMAQLSLGDGMGWDKPLSILSLGVGWEPGDKPPAGDKPLGSVGDPLAVPMRQISSESLERALAMRGMSQAMLARSLNVDRSTINRWINGSRPIGQRYRPMLWELLGAALQEV